MADSKDAPKVASSAALMVSSLVDSRVGWKAGPMVQSWAGEKVDRSVDSMVAS